MPHAPRPSRIWNRPGKSFVFEEPRLPARVEPVKGADLVDADDPAFTYVVRAGLELSAYDYDLSDPDVARRVVEKGRRDYTNAQEQAEREAVYRERSCEACKRPMDQDAVAAGSVVYYMRIGNRVKIGVSTRLAERLAAINPEELLIVEPGDAAVEHLRHVQFGELRTHGEWFRWEGALVEHVEELRRLA